MSFIRASGLGPLTASNTATIVDPATPASGSATLGPLVSFAPVTASGTAVTFTGIPSWAKRITVISYALSTTSTSPIILQLGSSGGFVTSGYAGMVQYGSAAGYTATTNNSGIQVFSSGSGGNSAYLNVILHLLDSSTNRWVTSGVAGDSAAGSLSSQFAWGVALSGTLTQVRWTTVNGTDTFDAGTVNVMYE